VYNDNGRSDNFNYALANGVYNITIGQYHTGDIAYIEVEGIVIWNATVPNAGVTEVFVVCHSFLLPLSSSSSSYPSPPLSSSSFSHRLIH
jgi:hypothetical protein